MVLLKSLTFIGAILFSTVSYSQSEEEKAIVPIEFRLIGGLSFVSIHGNKDYNTYGIPKLGYSLGFSCTFLKKKRFEIQSTLDWEVKGYETKRLVTYTPDMTGLPTTVTGPIYHSISNGYVVLSVIPHYLIGATGRIFIGVGPYIGYAVWGEEVYEFRVLNNRDVTHGNNGFYKLDYGPSLEFGGNFMILKKQFQAKLQANYGLVQLYKAVDLFPTIAFQPLYNQSYALVVGYRFK